jgi:23S rRNA pseudouridine1911/1915/1917 synthase
MVHPSSHSPVGTPLDPVAVDAPGEDVDPAGDAIETRRTAVDESSHGERLDKVLVALAGEFSRTYLQALVAAGRVRIDGRTSSTASRRVQAGQHIEIDLVPTAQSQAFRPEGIPLLVVYEDAQLIVLDKPAGLVVHPAAGNWSGTLLNGLLAHHAGAAVLPRAGIVHRLDKDTSGLMVVAKTIESMTSLTRAIAAREVSRRYLALCHGDIGPVEQTIDAPLARDPVSRVRMAVVPGGKAARTDVERLACRDRITAVRCRLHTGRTHQIRVHLAWRGHPLVSDTLYGGAPALGLQRQALHAHELGLRHPITGRDLTFVSQPPADFDAAWREVAGAA